MFKLEQHDSTKSGPAHVVAAAAPDALTAHKHNLTKLRSRSLMPAYEAAAHEASPTQRAII